MLTIKNLEQFTDRVQTSIQNVVREYCQHLFLSALYKQPGSERLLFKGGTALRIVYHSPRYSEDLDFTGMNIRYAEIEDLLGNALVDVEHIGIKVELEEGKATSGGYLGIAMFHAYDRTTKIQIEISLRQGKSVKGERSLIDNNYVPPYTLVHLPKEKIIESKMEALAARHKPRDFYDYFFLLSGDDPTAKEKANLMLVEKLLKKAQINFHSELREFLPASHSMHLRDFKRILEGKIEAFIGKR